MEVLAAVTKFTRSSLIELANGHFDCSFHFNFTKVVNKGTVCSSTAGVLRKVGGFCRRTYVSSIKIRFIGVLTLVVAVGKSARLKFAQDDRNTRLDWAAEVLYYFRSSWSGS